MAAHIASVRSSGIPQVSKAEFFRWMQPGDLVFCWGNPAISKEIERFTGGPSHVLKVWLADPSFAWSTCESEFGIGVRWGQFNDYMSYPGDLVLCRRPLTLDQVRAELRLSQTLLDQKYDTIEFASLVARKIDPHLPLIQPRNELYCSGLQQAIAKAAIPFKVPDVPWATPEQLFTEESVTPICALLEATADTPHP